MNSFNKEEKRELSQMWKGFCPESWLKGNRIRMKLNDMDFFESEATGLQIAVLKVFKLLSSISEVREIFVLLQIMQMRLRTASF